MERDISETIADKDKRISAEYRRLRGLFKVLPKKTMTALDSLIRRAANIRIILEDLELDLKENGYTEIFEQKNMSQCTRTRPTADMYVKMTKNYQSAMKQLLEFLPTEAPKTDEDEFESFLAEREEDL